MPSEQEIREVIEQYHESLNTFLGHYYSTEYVLHYANEEDLLQLRALIEQELHRVTSSAEIANE